MAKSRQLTHEEVNNKSSNFQIVVLCENIRSPVNLGMIFRSCEAMGVAKILIYSQLKSDITPRVKKVSRGTSERLPYEYIDSVLDSCKEYRSHGWAIFALELTTTSSDIRQRVFHRSRPHLLIIGSENTGVSSEILDYTDGQVHINMYGKNTSINVSNALAIALYEITNQLNS